MTKFTFIFGLFLIILFPAYGQKIENDIERFSLDSIKGTYIPKDLNDCFRQIDKFLNDTAKLEVSGTNEAEFSTNAHFGLGLWIRNNWQLWGGSRLSKYFNELGIFHPDDMSGIILVSYYRHLDKKDIKLDEQIQYYKNYWEKDEKENREENKEFFEYEVGDTVLFNYLLGFATSKQMKDFLNKRCVAKGIIVDKDENQLLIKVRLLEDCSKKGIIFYDSEKSKQVLKPKQQEILYIKKGAEKWFKYLDWEPSNK